MLAGQVGIGDHAHVGAGVILGGQAGVLSGKTLETRGTVLWGTPAKPLQGVSEGVGYAGTAGAAEEGLAADHSRLRLAG